MQNFFKSKTINKEAQNIIAGFITEGENIKNDIVNIVNNEKAVIPIAFSEQDVVMEAPTLFDDIFHIMFLRQMMKYNMGSSSIYSSMSYAKEVHDIFKINNEVANKYYEIKYISFFRNINNESYDNAVFNKNKQSRHIHEDRP